MLLFVLYIGKRRAEKSNDKTSSLYLQLINTSVLLFIYELFSRKSSKLCSSSEIFVIIRVTDFQKIFYEQNFTRSILALGYSVVTRRDESLIGIQQRAESREIDKFCLEYLTSGLTEES